MKANNLQGEYCMTCASILDDVQRNHRRVIVLDSQCAAVFHQSGDAALLDERVNPPSKIKEAVEAGVEKVKKAFKHEEKESAKKAEHKSFQGRKR